VSTPLTHGIWHGAAGAPAPSDNSDNDNNPYPDERTEIEDKYNVDCPEELDRILKIFIERGLASQEFCDKDTRPYHEKVQGFILSSTPVSWYLDDRNLSLNKHGVNARSRIAAAAGIYETAIKGNPRGFNGEGGAIRTEDEKSSSGFGFAVNDFQHPDSRALLSHIEGERLYLYLATQVHRQMIGVEIEHDGKRFLFEVAFDPIEYICQTDQGLKTFATVPQIEIEYFNPGIESHKDLAQALGLEPQTEKDIEQAMGQLDKILHDIAKELDIALSPSTISKGEYGFKELRAQGLLQTLPLRTSFGPNGQIHYDPPAETSEPLLLSYQP